MKINREKITQQIILTYDEKTDKFFINNKEVNRDWWLNVRSLWENEVSYNHLPQFIKKYGFTECNTDRSNKDIYKLIFTTYKQ